MILQQASVLPVIVHGGGKAVTDWEKTLGRKASFVEGLRVTDADALELVQMVLAGKVNGDLVAMLNARGIKSIGLTGADGEMLLSRPRKKPAGLKFVGEIERVNVSTFVTLGEGGFVPVIAPLGVTEEGQFLNINADTVAGELAKALLARHFLLLTDVPGVQDKDGEVLPNLTAARARQLIRNGTISGGMIPKVTACLDALEGVPTAHIVDGREPHAVLRQLLTLEPVGTQFTAKGR
jgi:acetylglutamate kinase